MRQRPILVLEDCDEDFETVLDAARRGQLVHPILRASSGGDCLHQLRSVPPGRDTSPVLALLDLNTPGDDGREVLRQIRSDSVPYLLPLVVLSASANPRDLQFCYAHGANAYHVKPVHHALHLQLLQQIFAYWLGCAVLTA